MPRSSAWLLLALLISFPSCSTPGLGSSGRVESYALVRLELDPTLMPNAGFLPIFREQGGESFGLVPRAIGYLRTTEQRKVAIEVTIREPLVGLGGRMSVNEYSLLQFFGTIEEDGSKILPADASVVTPKPGIPTVLHVQRENDHLLRVQPASGDKLLPYVYYFARTPMQPSLINAPPLE